MEIENLLKKINEILELLKVVLVKLANLGSFTVEEFQHLITLCKKC
jgi:hypothetical protein